MRSASGSRYLGQEREWGAREVPAAPHTHGYDDCTARPCEAVRRSQRVELEDVGREKIEQVGVSEEGSGGGASADESVVKVHPCAIMAVRGRGENRSAARLTDGVRASGRSSKAYFAVTAAEVDDSVAWADAQMLELRQRHASVATN